MRQIADCQTRRKSPPRGLGRQQEVTIPWSPRVRSMSPEKATTPQRRAPPLHVIDEQRPRRRSTSDQPNRFQRPIRLAHGPEVRRNGPRASRTLAGRDEAHDQGVARHTAARAESRVCDEIASVSSAGRCRSR